MNELPASKAEVPADAASYNIIIILLIGFCGFFDQQERFNHPVQGKKKRRGARPLLFFWGDQ
jgi:hypothetical protein